ncbi:MAG: FMN-binding protein [Anaerolineaceae bacterium]|nr:FMN-binding protein [Anaerolineaceae bacterium]
MDTVDANANSVPTSSPLLAQQPDTLVLSKSTAVTTNRPQPTSASPIIASHTKSTAAPDVPTGVPSAVPTDVPTIVPTDIPTDIPTNPPPPTATPAGQYKDGTYDGPIVDAYYGNVQVEAVIQGGKITDVRFLDYPQDRRTSRYINSQAVPWLTQEAVQVQSANVDLISGATFTSEAFVQSLQSALDQAHV